MSQTKALAYRAEKSNEWYTPPRYLNAACKALGGDFDLDPASCFNANKIVKAVRYYDKEQNGLIQPWSAKRLWISPPYGRSLNYELGNIGVFMCKLLQEYYAGNVEQAIALVTAQHDTQWFQDLWQFPLCFVNHKIHFITTSPTKKNPTATHMFANVFAYLGPNIERFFEVFDTPRFGHVIHYTKRQELVELWPSQQKKDISV